MTEPFFDYNINTPYRDNSPSVDQPNMETNTNSIFGWAAIDHIGFNASNGGYHNQASMPNQSAPGVPSGLNGVYYVNSNLPQFQNGTSSYPIALVNAISTMSNGYINLSGFIIQWGVVNGTHSGKFNGGDTGTVTFATSNINFPNNIFNITTQACASFNPSPPSSAATIAVRTSTILTTGFSWVFVTNSGQYDQFFWLAIGN